MGMGDGMYVSAPDGPCVGRMNLAIRVCVLDKIERIPGLGTIPSFRPELWIFHRNMYVCELYVELCFISFNLDENMTRVNDYHGEWMLILMSCQIMKNVFIPGHVLKQNASRRLPITAYCVIKY